MPVLRATADGGRTWYTVTVGLSGKEGPPGERGEPGPKGDPGVGVAIKGSVPTPSQLPTNASVGDGYLIESNGHLYVYSGPGTGWVDAGLIRGPQGIPGEVTLAIGDERYVRRAGGTWTDGQVLGSLRVTAVGGKQGLTVSSPSPAVPVALSATGIDGTAYPNSISFDPATSAWTVQETFKATAVIADNITASKKMTAPSTLAGDTPATVTTKDYVDAVMPTGAIIAYGGLAAPAGWAICNGDAHGSLELEKVLGSKNTPDLRDRFVVAAGREYSRGDTGGAKEIKLDPTHLPRHNHGAAGNHYHLLGRDGTGLAGRTDMSPDEITGYNWKQYDTIQGGGARSVTGVDNWSNFLKYRHQHWVTISGGTTDAGSHTHTAEFGNADGSYNAHENRPPYYALLYIIKK